MWLVKKYFLGPILRHGCGAKPVLLKTCMAEEPLNSPGFLSAQHVLLPKSQERPSNQRPKAPRKNRSHVTVVFFKQTTAMIYSAAAFLSCSNCLSFSHRCASVINTRPSFTWNAKFSSGWSWKLMAQVCHSLMIQNGRFRLQLQLGSGNGYGHGQPWWPYFCCKGGGGDAPKHTAQPVIIQLLTKYYYIGKQYIPTMAPTSSIARRCN